MPGMFESHSLIPHRRDPLNKEMGPRRSCSWWGKHVKDAAGWFLLWEKMGVTCRQRVCFRVISFLLSSLPSGRKIDFSWAAASISYDVVYFFALRFQFRSIAGIELLDRLSAVSNNFRWCWHQQQVSDSEECDQRRWSLKWIGCFCVLTGRCSHGCWFRACDAMASTHMAVSCWWLRTALPHIGHHFPPSRKPIHNILLQMLPAWNIYPFNG